MINILISIHIAFGSLALLSGALILILKKGNSVHKRIGKLYFVTGFLGTTVSLIIASSPDHYSLFLFTLGILTLYFLIGGFFAFKISTKQLKGLSLTMMVTSLIMILYAFYLFYHTSFGSGSILLFCGLMGMANAYLVDYRIFIKQGTTFKGRHRNSLHFSKMIGSYICMTTAFVVVNNIMYYGILNWILPALIGSLLIGHYIRVNRR
ncbi:hypothetical protein [Galbibacter sp.]|jgi:uncharacterized membrane protein|uniref:hypothetical protein n=1 Tax=Galbibacter sp. TaxID=2918471 RepID=UPI003A9295C0